MTAGEAAEIFRKIAARLEKNADEPFGGVFLAIPPEGEPVEATTLSGSKQNLGQFWGTVQASCAAAIQRAEEDSRRMRGFSG